MMGVMPTGDFPPHAPTISSDSQKLDKIIALLTEISSKLGSVADCVSENHGEGAMPRLRVKEQDY